MSEEKELVRTQELENEPIETQADYKKMGITLGAVVFGVLFTLFGLNFAADKSRKNNEVNEPAPSKQTTTVTSASSFEDEVFKTVGNKRNPAQESTDIVGSASIPNYRQQEGGNSLTSMLGPDLVEQEKGKHDALEMKRALLSSRSAWGLKSPVIESSVATGSTRRPIPNASPPSDDRLSSDDQRLMIANRLKEAEALKQRILQGDTSSLDNSQNLTTQLNTLEASFSPPPTNIVGFTKENTYNASTEGLLKLPIGTLIPAITAMKTNSDYSGSFKATVSQDVFDLSGEYVLVPRGAQVILKSVSISNVNEPISSRMGITVPWIVLPNGNKIDLSKSSGMDREGINALGDMVDRHLMAQFFGVAAYALVATETSRAGTSSDSDSSYAGDVGEGLRSQAAPLAQKYLSLTPTITLRAGQSMNIMIEDEIFLSPWRNIYEDYL
ncbi:TrbI/VirB10 family protein [Aliivibrio sp. S3MY1]|uniref:TrbI/VirB10 family protein n=1 Tax=Aliivibrio sp. S3MY1 TaxID=3028424 RepID=UPI002379AC57|nr:TrbI/VirB10 family protein [Aliivibrio sp. S3MY1]MDD9196864.1 TrbI/VirB10 family protein [Aliivibrio sp. S3MY1]